MSISRRHLLQGGAALAAAPFVNVNGARAQAEGEKWKHALSLFGEIKYPADFRHYDYVNPNAPKGGVARQIAIPVANVYALYARETGHGMTFDLDGAKPSVQAKGESEAVPTSAKPPAALPAPSPDPKKPTGGKPTLRRIK